MRLSKISFGIISLLLAVILTGCNNSVETKLEEESSEYTQLYISIESSELSARTIMPEQISLDGLSFKLLGAKSGAPLNEIKTWNNKNDIGSSAISIKPGEWNFTLNAYSAGKLVLTCSKQNVFIQGVSNTICFILDEPSEYFGSVDVTFDFPVGTGYVPSARKVVAKLVKDSDSEIEVDSQVLIPETYENDSTKQFVRYQNLNVEEGYYFLRFYIYQIENADYTNFHSTYIRVEPGLESKGVECINTLERRHKIILNLNGGTWNEGVQISDEYSEFEELPVGNATFKSDYWTDATLEGWYELPGNGDLSNIIINTTLPYRIENNTVLYAKWTITCKEENIQTAFDNFPEGRFDIKVEDINSIPCNYTNQNNINKILLNNSKKVVSLDYSVADIKLSDRYNGVWKYVFSESNSLLSLKLPKLTKQYMDGAAGMKTFEIWFFNNAFIQCKNLTTITFAETISDFEHVPCQRNYGVQSYTPYEVIYNNENGKYELHSLAFDDGVIVQCKDGELVLTND